jgi:hypothetical protein
MYSWPTGGLLVRPQRRGVLRAIAADIPSDRNSRDLARTDSNLGLAYADFDDDQRAIEYCDPQLTITREIGNRLAATVTAEVYLQIRDQIGGLDLQKLRRNRAEWQSTS